MADLPEPLTPATPTVLAAAHLPVFNSAGSSAISPIIKRVVIWTYCRGWISQARTQRIFDRFDLKGL